MDIKNYVKRNPWVAIVATILATVIICGAVVSFTDVDLKLFAKELNKDNLLYGAYDDFKDKTDASGISYKQKDGVITINGTIPAGDDAVDSEIVFASLELDAGTYTYTCFDKPTVNTYFSYIKYQGSDGSTHAVYGDFESSNVTMSGVTVDGYKTFTLSQKTTVDFVIRIKPGVNCFNLKAYPCLAKGEAAISFYADK